MIERKIFLIGGTDDEFGILRQYERGDTCKLGFTYRKKTVETSASDFFEAFCQIRLAMEADRLLPFCYGASLNVYPSGMSRDMGGGLTAYKMSMGKPSRKEDLVHIFSEGADVIPAYVAIQKAFFEGWLNAPKA